MILGTDDADANGGFAEGDLLDLRIFGERWKAGNAIDFAVDFRHHFLHIFDVATQFGQDNSGTLLSNRGHLFDSVDRADRFLDLLTDGFLAVGRRGTRVGHRDHHDFQLERRKHFTSHLPK